MKWIRKIEASILEEAIRIREDLHQYPELAFQEQRTSRVVKAYLSSFKLDIVSHGIATTGVVGVLNGKTPGRTLALRADMDALPLKEETGLPFSSLSIGKMHACGHDGHTAILLATANVLSRLREHWCGSVKFVFQPAEESGNGAQKMAEHGVLTGFPKAEGIVALHARPQIDVGQIELDPVPAAATLGFDLKIKGKASHAAYPHLGIDSIVAGSTLVTTLQQLVARQLSPFEQAVITIGSFQSGSVRNIIPGEALLLGTIRTRSSQVEKKLCLSLESMVRYVGKGLGVEVEVLFQEGTPCVVNDPVLMDLVKETGEAVLGEDNVLESSTPTMGGEDFGFFLAGKSGVPGCLYRLGVETDEALHTSRFDFGSRAVETGILMMTNIALRFLAERRG